MLSFQRRSLRSRLFLDLGSSAIRLCELTQTRNGYQLTRYLQKEYNSDPAQDEEIRRKVRVTALKELLKEAKIGRRKVFFAVPGQSVFTRTRPLPPVPEYKVTQIVRYEIQQQIPFSLDQIAMDYQILARNEAGGFEVMMAAIKVDVVDKQLDILREAKLAVEVVDVSPLAAYNWLKHTGEFGDDGECVAVIDLGASTTDIVIERAGQFRFTRPLNIGGNDITQAIAAEFAMNFSDAEKAKRQRAFAPSGDAARDGKAGEVVGKALQRLVGEIMRSFAYFRSLPGGGAVNRVVLCGGGACLRNIVPYMQQALGVQVRIAQPLAGLAIGPGAQQASEAPEQSPVVLGLALRTLAPVPIAINLIPPRVLEEARHREQYIYYGLISLIVVLILASIIPVKKQENDFVLQKMDTLKRFIQMYDPMVVQSPNNPSQRINELNTAKGVIGDLLGKVQVLDQVRKSADYWLDELSLVNEARPSGKGIWFCNLTTANIQPNTAAAQPNTPQPTGLGGFRAGGGGLVPSSITVQPFVGGSGSGGGGVSRTGGSGRLGNLRGNAGGGGSSAPVPSLLQPGNIIDCNGFQIEGYAQSPEVIQEFVNNLKTAETRLPDQRFLRVNIAEWSDKTTVQHPSTVLFDCMKTQGNASSETNLANLPPEQIVYYFIVFVAFERLDQAPAPPVPATPADAPAGTVAANTLGVPAPGAGQ